MSMLQNKGTDSDAIVRPPFVYLFPLNLETFEYQLSLI